MQGKTFKCKLTITLRVLVLLVAAGGFVWFLLPWFQGGYNVGCVLGQLLCGGAAAFALIVGRFKKRGLKMLVNICLGVFLLVVCWCGILGVKICSAQGTKVIPQGTTVAVLGAKVLKDGTPSGSLKTRLDVALARLQTDSSARCIVTGGKGVDEPITEAQCAKTYLVQQGIDPTRIFMEDQSTDTQENMGFTKGIAQANNLGTNLAIATQGFHQYRAGRLARDMGFAPYALIAETNPLLYPGYFGRELLSMTKYYVSKLL